METSDQKNLFYSFATPSSARFVWQAFFKRAFDILSSVLGLILLSPIIVPVVIMLRREGPGPILYRGPRLGLGCKPFHILKFRTMYERAESYNGLRITAKSDNRITPMGSWLRATKFNELPQLWNVLVGDMSMVGPRPEDPEIANTWPVDAKKEILSIRPGITSPASVLYRDEENILPAQGTMEAYFHDILPDKLRLDLLYVRKHSILGDLDILFWTAMAIFPRLARQHIPESRLFYGPFYSFVQRHISWFVRDFAVSLITVGLAGLLWRVTGPIDWGIGPLSLLALMVAILFSAVNVFLGLDHVIWSRASSEDGMVLIVSNGITFLILLIANYLQQTGNWLPLPPLPVSLIILMTIFTLFGTLLARYRIRLLAAIADRFITWRSAKGGFGERVLILGAGEAGQIANWLMRREALRKAFKVVGMVDDDPSKQGMRIDGCRVLGGTHAISELVKKHDVGVILFAITKLPAEALASLIKFCDIPNVQLVMINDILQVFQDRLTGKVK
jgi:lipopolysaccharide/colanic/teichoic acid biosynthesis glycosyltransferase